MKKISIIFLLLLVSCNIVTHENAQLYWAKFSYMDAKTYYSYLEEEWNNNSRELITKTEFIKLREKGYSLEDLKDYIDFCHKNDNFFCVYKNVSSFIRLNLSRNDANQDYIKNNLVVWISDYVKSKEYFDSFTREDGQQCIVKKFDIEDYETKLYDEYEKKVDSANKARMKEVNKNIEELEKFIEQEYKKSFHEKITISLKNNFKDHGFVPKQWNVNNHYIKVTSDGDNINVIKDDKLIHSSSFIKYMYVNIESVGDTRAKAMKKIKNLVEIYKNNNVSKNLQEKCKKYLPL